jgi:hypothetical protein
MIKQQVTTVTSSRECVDEQSQRVTVRNVTPVTPAKRQKMGRRSNSPTRYVSWTSSPSEILSGKETRSYTQESIRSENMDRHGQTGKLY